MNIRDNRDRSYLLVTPVRDEASHLKDVVRHVAGQSIKPVRWVLIDDHSRDGSLEICARAARRYPWIRTQCFEGPARKRQLRAHVYEVLKSAYECGIDLCREEGVDYRYVAFLDADMFPQVEYYERLIRILEKNPAMGIVSGGVYVQDEDGQIRWEKSPVQWPWGGARLLTRKCIEEIGGVVPVNSADAVAAIRAMKCGYEIRQFKEIKVIQARPTSSGTGLLAGYFQKGIDDHYLGYSLPYAVVKGFQKGWSIDARLGVSYLAGYVCSLLRRRERIDDPIVRGFCRRRLTRRILSRDLPPQRGVWPKRIKTLGG